MSSSISRKTFRPASETAWQKQLRDQHLAEGTPPVPHLSLKQARVLPVSRDFAAAIILKYEWLGTMAPTRYHYGLFFGAYCAGVCCVAVGNGTGGTSVHTFFRVAQDELATLARGACVHWAPPGSNSKLVSWTAKLLAQDSRARVLVAYSDTDAGEIGTIYQACNWVYIGPGSATRQWIAPNGRVYDQKHPSNIQHRVDPTRPRSHFTAALRAAGWREQPSNPKHRYVTLLQPDPFLAARLRYLRRPYPKRTVCAASVVGDTHAVQA